MENIRNEKKDLKELKKQFDKENYKKYMIRLRYDEDAELIEWIDEEIKRIKTKENYNGKGKNLGASEVFKEALYRKMYNE